MIVPYEQKMARLKAEAEAKEQRAKRRAFLSWRRKYERARYRKVGKFRTAEDRGSFYWETESYPVFEVDLYRAVQLARGISAISLL